MQLSYIPILGLLIFLNLQLFSAHPVYGLTNEDIDVLKVLLYRLETIPERSEETVQTEKLDNVNLEDIALIAEDEKEQAQRRLDEDTIRALLSARDLKTVRNDSSKRSSGCFGRRLDRIGSMSSLGCNTVGRKFNK